MQKHISIFALVCLHYRSISKRLKLEFVVNLPKPLFHWLEQRQTTLCHRQLLVITGDEQWTKDAAVSLLSHNHIQNALWVADTQTAYESISIKHYRSKLGQEYDWLVLNCFSGFRANAAMALSGTIKANGLMVLLCPELSEWPSYDDPERFNRISFGYQHQSIASTFIQHLVSCFYEDSFVATLSTEKFSGEVFFVENNVNKQRYGEQQDAVKSICKVATGHRNRPLVLTADRGRGKSSSLGIAAAKLMERSATSIGITAPHIQTVGQVFIHNKRLLPDALVTPNSVTYQSSTLTFKPIDSLLKDEYTLDLLLIDEASAIPVHILVRLAKKFSRVVFSGTVHGYEGSGRGFEMRFIKQLSQLKPSFKRLHMSQPIRWFKDDCLEQFWFNTFFHNVQQAITSAEPLNQPVRCQHISKTQLLNNKQLLGDIFRLLINAHYQTSQDDLQRLLDAPEIQCFILTKGTTLLGVAQIIEEGGNCFDELADNIADCSRRVRGHLVAQNIASSYNTPSFMLAYQWRISRIAITPEHQYKGLGKQLIGHVEQQAKQQNIKFLTASFGCNTGILKFWYSNEFLLTKLSSKPEMSSGEHSGICIKPLTEEALAMSDFIHQEFYQDLLYQMDKSFQGVSAELLLQILLFAQTADIDAPLHKAIVRQFASGKRAYSSCKRILKDYLISNPTRLSKLTTQQQTLLISALFQNKTDKSLRTNFNLSGKKQIEQALKTNFEQIIQD